MSNISLNLDELTAEKSALSDFLATPDAYSDPEFSRKNKRFSELETIIGMVTERQSLEAQLPEAIELSRGSDELAELAKDEVAEIERRLEAIEEELFILLTPKDPNDDKNVIIEIRAGAGGDEASLFAAELYRMYLRWCENHNFKTELISESANDTGGYKEVVFSVNGDSPYSLLKFEGGVHRVQRIPATES
ncbi:peptide chain release factor 1, partial [Candidatus Saccharibacteria bacterium 32-49-10]